MCMASSLRRPSAKLRLLHVCMGVGGGRGSSIRPLLMRGALKCWERRHTKRRIEIHAERDRERERERRTQRHTETHTHTHTHSETGRVRFRRVRFQTLSSVSFYLPHRAQGKELSELLSAYGLWANANSPKQFPELTEFAADLSEFSLPKHFSRNNHPPGSYTENTRARTHTHTHTRIDRDTGTCTWEHTRGSVHAKGAHSPLVTLAPSSKRWVKTWVGIFGAKMPRHPVLKDANPHLLLVRSTSAPPSRQPRPLPLGASQKDRGRGGWGGKGCGLREGPPVALGGTLHLGALEKCACHGIMEHAGSQEGCLGNKVTIRVHMNQLFVVEFCYRFAAGVWWLRAPHPHHNDILEFPGNCICNSALSWVRNLISNNGGTGGASNSHTDVLWPWSPRAKFRRKFSLTQAKNAAKFDEQKLQIFVL